MALFQHSIIQKYLNAQGNIDTAWQTFQHHFQTKEKQDNIRQSKEEQYQEGFLNDLFVSVLGYTLNPNVGYNLITEQKNQSNSKKADGAIILEQQGVQKIVAVIELKGMDTTDLNKIEQQAFNYKNSHNCTYVITSNFQKLRFYVQSNEDYLEFDLFKLNFDEFRLLYLCLALSNIRQDTALKLKNESLIEEEKITLKLYKEYSNFKKALYHNLVQNNPNHNPLVLFENTQKLLDRFLFILFAEDKNLLEPNFLHKLIDEWEHLKSLRVITPLYERIKQYFDFLDKGHKDDKGEIFAYNGGLFKQDNHLNSLIIGDDVLKTHLLSLIKYDFDSEIDVNILGHIFENSLNELDELKAELNGEIQQKSQTKRKKDGVFYTPKYITHYIVKQTLGVLCDNKKSELDILDEYYYSDKKQQAKTQKKHLDKLNHYRDWLKQLTICDPACGSGAFLNEALNFLINEHAYIDELESKLFGGGLVFPDVRNYILENNLFGVDINQESVEIAKLSLWLRTAEPHRKLSNLNHNIQCGNSLIDDPTVAGDKAFNWQQAFPHVFEKGGFDVVIGNPPYVRIQGLQDAYPQMIDLYNKNFKSATGNYDIYTLFMEKSLSLIHSDGLVSFILPHKFLVTDFGVGIRQYLAGNRLVKELLHFGSEIVFKDASTYTCIISFDKKPKDKIYFKKIKPIEILEHFTWDKMDYRELGSENWDLQPESTFDLIQKLKTQPYTIGDVFDRIFQGIASGGDSFFSLELLENKGKTGIFYSAMNNENIEIEFDILKPFIKGNEVSRYKKNRARFYTIFPYSIINNKPIPLSFSDIQAKYPLTANYFLKNETFLREREKGRFNNDNEWFLFSRKQGITGVENPKIMTQEISLGCNMVFDEKGEFYHPTTVYSFVKNPKFKIHDKFYLAILNSKIMWFFLKNTGTELRGGYFRFKTNYLKPFPLPEIPDNADEFITLADQMLSLNEQLQLIQSKFVRLIERKFEIEASKALLTWQNLSFKEFVKELAKKKIKLSLADEVQWEEFFLTEQQKAQELQTKIYETDKQIDTLVYQLYGLNDDEIALIEQES